MELLYESGIRRHCNPIAPLYCLSTPSYPHMSTIFSPLNKMEKILISIILHSHLYVFSASLHLLTSLTFLSPIPTAPSPHSHQHKHCHQQTLGTEHAVDEEGRTLGRGFVS